MALIRTVAKSGSAQPPVRAGPATPGTDYLSIARNAASEACRMQKLVAERERHVDELRTRIRNGDRWMATHDATHPRYEHNVALLDQLRWNIRLAAGDLREARFRLMHVSLNFHLACEYLTRDEIDAIDGAETIDCPDMDAYYYAQQHWEEDIR